MEAIKRIKGMSMPKHVEPQVLHSHSGIERELGLPKNVVLIDGRFVDMFVTGNTTPPQVSFEGRIYFKVPMSMFLKNGGIFRNLFK